MPVLSDLLGIFECEVEKVVAVGDHDVFFGRVVRAVCHDGKPLLYFNSGYAKLG
jgi:flavin reductase (DIM6/NTAB) family NADH-FMN oxidoreductase RutF